LPGKIQLGAVVNGVFWPIAERKAPGLLADIERKQAEQQAQAETTPPPAPQA
jgi:hypothetical protein